MATEFTRPQQTTDTQGNCALNITEIDLAVASALYPVLVDCARQTPVKKLTYGALINEAKRCFPTNVAIQMAIPVSLGRRLDVVRMFLNEHALPDLTSLVVNAGIGEVGSAFGENPEKVRAEVAAFDWSTVSEEFTLHINGLRKGIAACSRPKRSRGEAKDIMSTHYRQNRATLPKEIDGQRELIIELLCAGLSVEDAFEAAFAKMGGENGDCLDPECPFCSGNESEEFVDSILADSKEFSAPMSIEEFMKDLPRETDSR